jgi:hypothetical protein
VMSGEWRVWDWEKERWEEEVLNWIESGEGDDVRSNDAMAMAMMNEKMDNTLIRLGWGIYHKLCLFFRSNGLECISSYQIISTVAINLNN